MSPKSNGAGRIQIFCGSGKGKTAAALGLAVRALGRGLKVCFVAFPKATYFAASGEFKVLQKLRAVEEDFYLPFAHNLSDGRVGTPEDIRARCLHTLGFLELLYPLEHDVIILDESLTCIQDGYLSAPELAGVLKSKPANLQIILTGEKVPPEIENLAAHISEIKDIKNHHGVRGGAIHHGEKL